MTDWQLINTAPRDKNFVDLRLSFIDNQGKKTISPMGRIADAVWNSNIKAWEYDLESYLYEQSEAHLSINNGQAIRIVTHWKPYPLPPDA